MEIVDRVLPLINDVQNFPKAGITFKDISPLLGNTDVFRAACTIMAAAGRNYTAVAGIESRGFIFGSAIALLAYAGFIPVRKLGKLPGAVIRRTYGLEYGTDTIEIQMSAIGKGQKILLVDDILATGGTASAACELIEQAGGIIAGCVFLAEISSLNGRDKLSKYDVYSLIKY